MSERLKLTLLRVTEGQATFPETHTYITRERHIIGRKGFIYVFYIVGTVKMKRLYICTEIPLHLNMQKLQMFVIISIIIILGVG